MEAEIAGRSLSQTEKLAKILEVTKREWAVESDEVKAKVKLTKAELQKERGSAGEPSPDKFQVAINDLSYVASAFLTHIKQTTNWTGFLVLGGPKLDIGGEMAVAS